MTTFLDSRDVPTEDPDADDPPDPSRLPDGIGDAYLPELLRWWESGRRGPAPAVVQAIARKAAEKRIDDAIRAVKFASRATRTGPVASPAPAAATATSEDDARAIAYWRSHAQAEPHEGQPAEDLARAAVDVYCKLGPPKVTSSAMARAVSLVADAIDAVVLKHVEQERNDKDILDWSVFGGSAPAVVRAIAERTARALIERAFAALDPGSADKDALAVIHWVHLGAAPSRNPAAEADLVSRAVVAGCDGITTPSSPEVATAVQIITKQIEGTIRKREKDVKDRFTSRAIQNVVQRALTATECHLLVGRYRNGQHRVDVTARALDAWRELYGKLRSALERAKLLRILEDGARLVMDRRYGSAATPLRDLAALGWSTNHWLALEFEKMQEIVTVLAPIGNPHSVKREPQHAVLPDEREAAILFATSGVGVSDVATRTGMAVRDVEARLWNAFETLRWLFDDERQKPPVTNPANLPTPSSRYLNLGPAALANRDELRRVCDTPDEWRAFLADSPPTNPGNQAVRKAVCTVLSQGK